MGFGSGGGGFTPSPNNVPGSTKTGTDINTDVHEFTGSVDITGSLTLNGSAITGGGGGGGSPGGSNSQVQYNDGGAFGGASSLVYDDINNRVGIRTSTPSYELHVSGSDSSGSLAAGVAFMGYSDDSTKAPGDATWAHIDHTRDNGTVGQMDFALQQKSGGSTIVNSPTGGNVSLRIGGYVGLQLDSNSNVGINTAPSARLHVNTIGTENDLFRLDGVSNNVMYVSGSGKVGIGTGTPTAELHISSSTSDPLFRVDHTTQAGSKPILFVTGSGLVGIGTGAPRTDTLDTNRLHILGESGADQGQDPVFNTLLMLENNDHAGIQFMTPINKSGLICWGDADAARVAHFYFDHTSNRFNFDGNAFGTTNVMSIRSAGDSVNIGSTDFDMDGSNEACLHISSSTGGTGVGGPVLLRVDHADQPGAQPTLFVTGSGQVGIGTGTPVQTLSVSGSAAFSGAFGSTAIETLTANGTISANTGLTLIDASSSLAVNNTLSFTIANGTFVGQEKKIRGLIISGSDGTTSTGISIGGSNIDSPPASPVGLINLSSSFPGSGPVFQRAGCSLVWDGSKWLPVGNFNFNINNTGRTFI